MMKMIEEAIHEHFPLLPLVHFEFNWSLTSEESVPLIGWDLCHSLLHNWPVLF